MRKRLSTSEVVSSCACSPPKDGPSMTPSPLITPPATLRIGGAGGTGGVFGAHRAPSHTSVWPTSGGASLTGRRCSPTTVGAGYAPPRSPLAPPLGGPPPVQLAVPSTAAQITQATRMVPSF